MEDKVFKVQAALLDMNVGTAVKFGVTVTKYYKDAYEVGTWGRVAGVGSETAAELVVSHKDFQG